MMPSRPTRLAAMLLPLVLTGCGDYPQGYRDGLAAAPHRHWIVFGRSAYLSGYDQGAIDAFFKWVDSNSDYQSDGHMCIFQPGYLQARLEAIRGRSQP